MPPAGPDFSRLHQLHKDLKKVQDQLIRGPRQIKVRQKKIVDAQNELAAKEAELKEARSEADKKNLDLKSKESHIVDLKRKLNAAASNREYEVITGQIEADEAAMAVLEDETLEFMERVEILQKEVEDTKVKISDAETNAREFATQFEQKAAELQEKEKELAAQVKEAEKIIPTEIRDQYRRLVDAHGPDAMSECLNGVCSNCFVQVTPQSKVLVNSGKVLFCGSCGRLLYQAK